MDLNFTILVQPEAQLESEHCVSGLGVGGTFFVECYDKDGNLRWRDQAKNIIPNAILNDILNVYFNSGAQTSAFYIGIVDNAGFSAFAAADTMASHAGWTENINYSNGSRPVWTPGAASGQSISNPTPATFNMNPPSTITVKGFFLTSSNTLGGTSGNLDATAALQTPQQANNGDTLKVTYQILGTTS